MSVQTKTFLFKPKSSYNLNLSIQRLKRDHIYLFEKDAVYRTLKINQSLYLIKVYFQKEDEKEVKVECALLEGKPESIRNTLESMFSIHRDLNDIYGLMDARPGLRHLSQQFYGLHIFLEPDLFECLIKLIIAQQVNVAFATDLTRNLIESVSQTVFYGNKKLFVFPSPAQIACLRVDDLVKMKYNQRKAEYVIDFARKVHDGTLKLSRFHNMSDSAVMDELLKVRGIGPWTVACFMIFGLGKDNFVPASDIGIQKGVQKIYDLSRRPTKSEVLRLSGEWNPIGSYVSRYLWETLRS